MEGTIYIKGGIGYDYMLVDTVADIKKFSGLTKLNVVIDSPGGDVDMGFAIHGYLRSLGIPIKTIGSGLVASIATVIFMAGDERVMRKNTEFMIHLPWGSFEGTAEEMSEYADVIGKAEKRIVDFYKKNTGITEEAILPLMKAETWLTGEQAIALGFATSLDDTPVQAKASLTFKKEKPMAGLTAEDKSWIEASFGKLLGKFKKGANALLQVTAADNTTVLEFADLTPDATPVSGDIATVDGTPAEGEYLMPDGSTYVFTTDGTGALVEILPAEEGDDDSEEMAALKQENEQLKKDNDAYQVKLKNLEKDVVALKKAVTSKLEGSAGEKPRGNEGKGGNGTTRRLLKTK